jgi:putative ATPase
MKELNYGKEYKYSHDFEGNFAVQEFLPEGLENTQFYTPGNNSKENSFRALLRKRWGKKYNY